MRPADAPAIGTIRKNAAKGARAHRNREPGEFPSQIVQKAPKSDFRKKSRKNRTQNAAVAPRHRKLRGIPFRAIARTMTKTIKIDGRQYKTRCFSTALGNVSKAPLDRQGHAFPLILENLPHRRHVLLSTGAAVPPLFGAQSGGQDGLARAILLVPADV